MRSGLGLFPLLHRPRAAEARRPKLHPTQKTLGAACTAAWSPLEPGQVVLDPFFSAPARPGAVGARLAPGADRPIERDADYGGRRDAPHWIAAVTPASREAVTVHGQQARRVTVPFGNPFFFWSSVAWLKAGGACSPTRPSPQPHGCAPDGNPDTDLGARLVHQLARRVPHLAGLHGCHDVLVRRAQGASWSPIDSLRPAVRARRHGAPGPLAALNSKWFENLRLGARYHSPNAWDQALGADTRNVQARPPPPAIRYSASVTSRAQVVHPTFTSMSMPPSHHEGDVDVTVERLEAWRTPLKMTRGLKPAAAPRVC